MNGNGSAWFLKIIDQEPRICELGGCKSEKKARERMKEMLDAGVMCVGPFLRRRINGNEIIIYKP